MSEDYNIVIEAMGRFAKNYTNQAVTEDNKVCWKLIKDRVLLLLKKSDRMSLEKMETKVSALNPVGYDVKKVKELLALLEDKSDKILIRLTKELTESLRRDANHFQAINNSQKQAARATYNSPQILNANDITFNYK